MRALVLSTLLLVLLGSPAMAYIGPGAGIGLVGSFLALLFGMLLAVGVVLWWPIRYLRRRRRNSVATVEADGQAGAAGIKADRHGL